ncbi:MAG: OmpA-like protein [Ignavibacteria bacterium]|nr:OmpA-like protein [Ignavibacteria bacterium]
MKIQIVYKKIDDIRYKFMTYNYPKNKFLIIFIIIHFISFTSNKIYSQSNSDSSVSWRSYSIFGDYSWNHYNSDFPGLPGIPNCCPKFEYATGSGYSFGGKMEFSLPYSLQIGLKASYNVLDGEYSVIETRTIKVNDILTDGKIEHKLSIKLSDFGLEPYIAYNPIGDLQLQLGGKLSLLLLAEFSQFEKITEPADRGVFVDTKQRTRNENSGTINGVKTSYGSLFAGVSYFFPLNKSRSMEIAPELIYLFNTTNLLEIYQWSISSFRLGLSLRYSIKEIGPIQAPVIPEYHRKEFIDTIIVESVEKGHLGYKAGLIKSTGDKQVTFEKTFITQMIWRTDTIFKYPKPDIDFSIMPDSLKLRTRYVTELFPLLPYIFFEFNSSILPDFYQQTVNIAEYSTDNIKPNPLELNKLILKIIASRLKQHPDATITLSGFIDPTTEKDTNELAYNRAVSVQNYLNQEWLINTERIKITSSTNQNLTYTQNESGFAENRRVEISSNDPFILAPVERKNYKENYDIEPSKIEIKYSINPTIKVNYVSIDFLQKNRVIFSKEIIENSFRFNIETKTFSTNLIPSANALIRLNIQFADGQVANKETNLKILADSIQSNIERMSLVLFNIRSAELSFDAKNSIKDFIQRIPRNSIIEIIGYTDKLGDYQENRKLSMQRAINTGKVISKLRPDLMITNINGIGPEEFPRGVGSYETPIERFLSRTVQIEVKDK